MKTIRPLGNNVRVRLLGRPNLSKTIILLESDTHLHPNRDAEVTAVGPGKLLKNGRRSPMTVSIGDKVQISGICGSDGKHEGKHVESEEVVVGENDIYFIYAK